MIKTFAIAIISTVLMSCASPDKNKDADKPESNKAQTQQSFDMSSIPCGILQSGTRPHLIIEQDNGTLVDIIVPDWVWDTFVEKGGERIGNCAGQPEQNETPATEESSEEQTPVG